MSTDLKNLLHDLAEKKQASKATVEEWQASVAHLFADIRKWLKVGPIIMIAETSWPS